MSKLYKLKKWYSLTDAARRLTTTVGEEVTERDVRQLFVDRELPVSWILQHQPAAEVAAMCGAYFPGTDLYELTKGLTIDQGHTFGDPAYIQAGITWEKQSRRLLHLEGVFTLDLEEGGAHDYIVSLVTGKGGELYSFDGTIVLDGYGTRYQLLEPFDEDYLKKNELSIFKMDSYYPSSRLPDAEDIVIKREHLESFEARLNGGESPPEKIDLDPREYSSLYKMLLSFATTHYQYDPTKTRQDATSKIKNLVERNGFKISEDNIRKHLRAATEQLS